MSTSSVLNLGKPRKEAHIAMIMLHGRGGSAEDMAGLAQEFKTQECAYIIPQAPGHTWYPYRFIEPVERNEPSLSNALQLVASLNEEIVNAGIRQEKVIVLGFSQGACLALEYAARNGRRFGGVVAFSGGLIGDKLMPERYTGNFAGTPIFLGCSDIDPHIPLTRVKESSQLLQKLGANVTERIYPKLGHTVNADEIAFVNALIPTV